MKVLCQDRQVAFARNGISDYKSPPRCRRRSGDPAPRALGARLLSNAQSQVVGAVHFRRRRRRSWDYWPRDCSVAPSRFDPLRRRPGSLLLRYPCRLVIIPFCFFVCVFSMANATSLLDDMFNVVIMITVRTFNKICRNKAFYCDFLSFCG